MWFPPLDIWEPRLNKLVPGRSQEVFCAELPHFNFIRNVRTIDSWFDLSNIQILSYRNSRKMM
ncbi:hypothetical protein C0J52_05404 [Blattella germanica]|nr:hypothetical protein C0J52_05404 [Blattella germanica]